MNIHEAFQRVADHERNFGGRDALFQFVSARFGDVFEIDCDLLCADEVNGAGTVFVWLDVPSGTLRSADTEDYRWPRDTICDRQKLELIDEHIVQQHSSIQSLFEALGLEEPKS